MNRTPLRLILSTLLLLISIETVRAAEPLSGIWIRQVPQSGLLLLGSRQIRPGDVLTRDQASGLEFIPEAEDAQAVLRYLPISPEGTGAAEVLSFGKKKNEPPVALDSGAETYKNLPLRGRLKVTDPEQEPMTFSLVRQPRRGRVTLEADGSFLYTPEKNKVGMDSFVYTARDSRGGESRQATVTVEILRPSDSPMYVDTAGRSCSFAAQWMQETGLFVGETIDGSPCFQPDKALTQGEFLTMLLRALEIPKEEELASAQALDYAPVWLRPYLAAAIRSGLTGRLQETLTPDQPITGSQAAALLRSAQDLPRVQTACSQEIIFTLQEEPLVTRAQAAELFYALTRTPQ